VHHDKFLVINHLDALISQFILGMKLVHVSDSSSVHYQEFFTLHTACEQDQDRISMYHSDPARKLSPNPYDMYQSCVYSEKLLMMDSRTVHNMMCVCLCIIAYA